MVKRLEVNESYRADFDIAYWDIVDATSDFREGMGYVQIAPALSPNGKRTGKYHVHAMWEYPAFEDVFSKDYASKSSAMRAARRVREEMLRDENHHMGLEPQYDANRT